MSDHNMMGHDMSSHTNMDHNMPGHDMPGNGGDHSGHSSPMCKMNMLFTWDYENVCVVFKWWHIYNAFDLVLSVIAIAVLAAGYEFLKYRYKQFVRKNRGFKGTYSAVRFSGFFFFFFYLNFKIFFVFHGRKPVTN